MSGYNLREPAARVSGDQPAGTRPGARHAPHLRQGQRQQGRRQHQVSPGYIDGGLVREMEENYGSIRRKEYSFKSKYLS